MIDHRCEIIANRGGRKKHETGLNRELDLILPELPPLQALPEIGTGNFKRSKTRYRDDFLFFSLN